MCFLDPCGYPARVNREPTRKRPQFLDLRPCEPTVSSCSVERSLKPGSNELSLHLHCGVFADVQDPPQSKEIVLLISVELAISEKRLESGAPKIARGRGESGLRQAVRRQDLRDL